MNKGRTNFIIVLKYFTYFFHDNNVRRSNNRNVSEGPTFETSATSTGSAKGVRINEIVTFVAKPSSPGILHGKAQGVFSTESGMARGTGEGIGRTTSSGIKWRGANFSRNQLESWSF